MATAKQNASKAAEILRNTKIPQGSKYLIKLRDSKLSYIESNIECACCKGVLSHEFKDQIDHRVVYENKVFFDHDSCYSKHSLRKIIGLREYGEIAIEYSEDVSVYLNKIGFVKAELSNIDIPQLNDEHKLTFEQMADLWEKFPKAYFVDTYFVDTIDET